MNLLINKTVKKNYEIIDSYESGIKLTGWEVKTLRKKHGSIREAYITVDNEVFLVGAHIPIYQPGHKEHESLDPYQKRKLLLHVQQIEKLREAIKQKGFTIVPIRIYEKGNIIKIEIGIARGKKLFDKRKDLKNKSMKRETDRIMKDL